MCGRYTLTATPAAVAAHFGLGEAPELEARYNVAPSQDVPVVRVNESAERTLQMRHWGLVPHWAADPGVAARLINARSETAGTKPAFRDAFRRRRCLVPADGFYEWAAGPGGKRPHHIRLPDAGLFAFAGLYERWRPVGPEPAPWLESCTVLTAAANDRVRPLHDRMPVILDPERYAAWLDPDLDETDAVARLLEACTRESRCLASLEAVPVGLAVNDARRDDPGCLAAPGPPAQRELFRTTPA